MQVWDEAHQAAELLDEALAILRHLLQTKCDRQTMLALELVIEEVERSAKRAASIAEWLAKEAPRPPKPRKPRGWTSVVPISFGIDKRDGEYLTAWLKTLAALPHQPTSLDQATKTVVDLVAKEIRRRALLASEEARQTSQTPSVQGPWLFADRFKDGIWDVTRSSDWEASKLDE